MSAIAPIGRFRLLAVAGLLTAVSMPTAAAEPGKAPASRDAPQAKARRQPRPQERRPPEKPAVEDAKHRSTGKPDPPHDPDLARYGIYQKSAPRPTATEPVTTRLPLRPGRGTRIALVGNTLLERAQHFGYFEAMLHQAHAGHELVVRNLAWPADEIDLQPRPDNFADTHQHLKHERADVIFAAFGFNESFAGAAGLDAFRGKLRAYLQTLKSRAFNGRNGPKIVLISPIANENIEHIPAADLNNERIEAYAEVMRQVAAEQGVGFVDGFTPTLAAMRSPGSDLTINGVHLNERGYALFARTLFERAFGRPPPQPSTELRNAVVDKNRQYLRRFRPVNSFYYTGGRNAAYGYLDFLPAMRNFDRMVANRDRRIWALAQGHPVPPNVDDSNVPPLPQTKQARGANRWMTAAEEQKAFHVDPRFEVHLFAGEEEFPDIAAPIQMRWDSRGRLWVSCSTTYPHVYPGQEPNDKLVILEDTDSDGRADKSSVFADDLHIPLSFEFGDGGVYVSEMPHLTFLKDTDDDGRADLRRVVLSGFGTEDSHHALHDFVWTPDGDLLFRESIFHHSQVETAYGPVRQQNSGWFRFDPRTQRLTSFGTYHSTNPWGVTFDQWGQHVASHPIYAAAFHSLDPPYPQQHPKPTGLRAYSGTCGQEFVDFGTFPESMQGDYIKVRYKPTNRVEIHHWQEQPFGYDEKYVGDLIFSTNLSFIPVDIRFGPRGALYVCDWYNPAKGHAQYSLRDSRRDRHSGRIWRITARGKSLQQPPKFADAPIADLLEILRRPEYRYRYWAKRELRLRDRDEVARELDRWVAGLNPDDPRLLHHRLEAIWMYRAIDKPRPALLRELLACKEHPARAAATEQLRYWHAHLPDSIDLLRRAANDEQPQVRMQAAIAASYIGTREALDAMLDVYRHPRGGHLQYAINCALGSHKLRRHWEGNPKYQVARLLKMASGRDELREPTPSGAEAEFDSQQNLKTVNISCIPERMLFSQRQFAVKTGQPVKLVFTNPDATDHNLLILQPDALEEVGMAANDMAKDPRNANSDFVPPSKADLILHAAPMIGPTRDSRVHVLRFGAPAEPGVYPYVCTFPGHWVVMNGLMVVADDLSQVESMLAAREPAVVRQWSMDDFSEVPVKDDEQSIMRGMQAFMKARCNQCHAVAGHGVELGPKLDDVAKRYRGAKLLRQLIEPSHEINEKFRTYLIERSNGTVVTGVIAKDEARAIHVIPNLLLPDKKVVVPKQQIESRVASRVSPMPPGMLNVLTKEEILDLVSFLQSGGYQLPPHLQHKHHHKHGD